MGVINKIIKSKYMPYAVILILTIIISAPMFTMNLALNNEAILHMSRIIAIDEVIKDGIFPAIINSKFMDGFGYALNLFYGPLTTYVPIILLNIFRYSGIALKIFTAMTVFISGIAMYKFMYNVTKRKSMSLIGAIIYMSAPYKLSDIYSRNAVGEYTAFIFIPILFEGLYNLVHGDKRKNYLIAIGTIGLVLSHTITTVYIAIFAILYLLINIDKLNNFEIWKKGIINVLIALLVCAFYVVPLLEHSAKADYTIYSKECMFTMGIDVRETTIGFKDLFASEFGNQEIRFSIGIVTCFLMFLTIFCVKKVDKKHKKIYLDFILLAFISLYMCTRLFPWLIMPGFMTVIQFAWRNLGFLAFFIALVCGINAVVFSEKILKKEWLRDTFLFGVIISTLVFAALGVVRNFRFDDVSKENELDEYISKSVKIWPYGINREYMPLKAYENIDYVDNRDNKVYILGGNANITFEQKNKLEYTLKLNNIEEKTYIELPYLYYLGYEVKVQYDEMEPEKLSITESDNGFLGAELRKSDNAVITLKYKGTLLEKVSYLISIGGVIILIIFIKKNSKKDN